MYAYITSFSTEHDLGCIKKATGIDPYLSVNPVPALMNTSLK